LVLLFFMVVIGFFVLAQSPISFNSDFSSLGIPKLMAFIIFGMFFVFIGGHWQITNKVDFNLINPPKNNFLKKYENKKIKTANIVLPVSPIFPIAYKRYAFLGDSFGNATPIAGEGTRLILSSSKILAYSIKKENLFLYEKIWKKKYLNEYIRAMAMRLDPLFRDKIMERINQNHQELCIRILKGEKVKFPKEIMNNIPLQMILKQIFFNTYLKIRYKLM